MSCMLVYTLPAISDHAVEAESLSKDIVTLLEYLCEKLEVAQSGGQMAATTPLLLDGIHAVLSKVPTSLQTRQQFVDLIWSVNGSYQANVVSSHSHCKRRLFSADLCMSSVTFAGCVFHTKSFVTWYKPWKIIKGTVQSHENKFTWDLHCWS